MYKDELKGIIKLDVFKMVEETLNYATVLITNRKQYEKYRHKVLGAANNCVRGLHKTIDIGCK